MLLRKVALRFAAVSFLCFGSAVVASAENTVAVTNLPSVAFTALQDAATVFRNGGAA